MEGDAGAVAMEPADNHGDQNTSLEHISAAELYPRPNLQVDKECLFTGFFEGNEACRAREEGKNIIILQLTTNIYLIILSPYLRSMK